MIILIKYCSQSNSMTWYNSMTKFYNNCITAMMRLVRLEFVSHLRCSPAAAEHTSGNYIPNFDRIGFR